MKMKCPKIGPCILILCIIIMSQTQCYGRSTLPHSKTSHCNTENSTTQRGSHDERISNSQKVLRSLGGTMRADHYARKAAFFEKELEICLAQMETCNLTMDELRDHLVSTVSTVRTSNPPSHTITPTAQTHESSSGIREVGQGKLTTAKNGNPDGSRDQNVNLTKPTTRLLEMFSKIEDFFSHHNYRAWNVSAWIDFLLHTVKTKVIYRYNKQFVDTESRVIPYEDAANMMARVFSEEEIVYADFILAEMENLNLVQRNTNKSTEKSNLPLPIEELRKFISPTMVRWIFFLLLSRTDNLREKVDSEPNLSLFEFCWCISKILDADSTFFQKWHTEQKVEGQLEMCCKWIRQSIEEVIERKDNEYAEPLLRSIKVLLRRGEEIEDEVNLGKGFTRRGYVRGEAKGLRK